MTIYEKALKEIYAAFDDMGRSGDRESVLHFMATVICQRVITGDPNEQKPVGLLGKSPIQSVIDDLATANRPIRNWRHP